MLKQSRPISRGAYARPLGGVYDGAGARLRPGVLRV